MSDHTATCASGARAETRGECDCGAMDTRPFRLRMVPEADALGKRKVELVMVGHAGYALTSAQACDLALALLEMARIEGQRWANANARSKR